MVGGSSSSISRRGGNRGGFCAYLRRFEENMEVVGELFKFIINWVPRLIKGGLSKRAVEAVILRNDLYDFDTCILLLT